MKHEIYLRRYKLAKKQISDRTTLLKAVFNGIKAVNTLAYQRPYTLQEVDYGQELSSEVMKLIARVTPRELMQVFPVHKEYKGEKYDSKDYFYTMKYLKQIDIDKPIGANLKEFLWNYYNWELWKFEIDHGMYKREYDFLKEEENAKFISEQIGNITKKISELQERQGALVGMLKDAAKDLDSTCTEYKRYKESKRIIDKISIAAYRAKKEFTKSYIAYIVIDESIKGIQEVITQERKKILEIDGLEEAIEKMMEISREDANNWIRMLNEIRAE